jgi:uncharacterized protein (TIRG00374 family)
VTRRLLLAVAVLGTLACIVLAFGDLDWHVVWRAFRDCDPLWLVPSLALFAGTVMMRALRWRSLFLPASRPSIGTMIRATLVGYLYLSILPVRAGEPARVLVLNQLSGRPKAEIAGTAIVERIFDLAALLLCFFALSPWLPAGSWARPLAYVAGGAALAIAAIVYLLRTTGDRGLRVLLRPFSLLPRVGRESAELAAVNLRQGLAGLHDRSTAVLALSFTMASWLLLGAACSVAVHAFHLHVSALAGMLVVIAVSLAAAIPSLPGGLGIFEAACVAALNPYGVPRGDAVAFAFAWHALNVVPFLLLGPPLAIALARRSRAEL